MFNKKVLAVALAAAFTSGAQAVVDLDATASQKVTYASEVVTTGAETVEVTNLGGLLDVTATLGFTIGAGTSKYVRFDLASANFASAPTITVTPAVAGPTVTATLSAGGSTDDAFVIYEIASSGADLSPDATVTISGATYEISTSSSSQVSYRLYETATGAANKLEDTLKFVNTEFTEITSASTGEFAVSTDNQATVATGFTEFSAASLGATTATIGYLDTDLLFLSAYDLDGTPVTAEDLLDDEQDIEFAGDFSFGTWTLESDSACNAGSPMAIVETEDGGIVEDVTDSVLAGSNWYICVDTGGDVIEKGTYSVTLADDETTDALGTISYDTTTIEVPYLTTFSAYNQRLYIVNRGNTAADYAINFVTEADTTPTALPAATGTVAANSVLSLKAVDVVSLDGKTRTSAVIEVEGIDSDIQAATQTVNLEDGTTDTVILNANSITSPSN